MKKIFILPIAVLLLSGCFHGKPSETTPSTEPASEASPTPVEPSSEPAPAAEPPAVELPMREITIDSGNLFFKPAELKLTLNQPVTISFTNAGVHTFTIDELGVNVPLKDSTAAVVFTPTTKGTFEYYCAVEGHKGAGMKGTVVVE